MPRMTKRTLNTPASEDDKNHEQNTERNKNVPSLHGVMFLTMKRVSEMWYNSNHKILSKLIHLACLVESKQETQRQY